MTKSVVFVICVCMAVLLMAAACREEETPTASSPTATAISTAIPSATPSAVPSAVAKATQTRIAASTNPNADTPVTTPLATSTPTSVPEPEPTATSTPRPHVVQVEPTLTPRPGDQEIGIDLLPIGEPGNYVNVAFGYWLQYPVDWYTQFGNRPLLASFSNLDPGTHNRQSMRENGCLVEVNVSSNIQGFTFETLMAQLPRSFPDAQETDLGGERAWRVKRSSDSGWDSEWVSVQHNDKLMTITLDYAKEYSEHCLPAWENMLANWHWFTPALAQYANPTYDYAISYPRDWYRFNAHQAGISLADQDPSEATDWPEFLRSAMVVEISMFDNDGKLPLKEWLTHHSLDVQLSNDMLLGEIVGVRVIADGPDQGIELMNGYYQGPLGRIYEISCTYPVDSKWAYRPIANAILYSFTFS